jgi:hypothetical protein
METTYSRKGDVVTVHQGRVPVFSMDRNSLGELLETARARGNPRQVKVLEGAMEYLEETDDVREV